MFARFFRYKTFHSGQLQAANGLATSSLNSQKFNNYLSCARTSRLQHTIESRWEMKKASWKWVSDTWNWKSHSRYYIQYTILAVSSLCPDHARAPWLCFSWAWRTSLGDSFSIPANRSLMYNFNSPSKYCMLNQLQLKQNIPLEKMKWGMAYYVQSLHIDWIWREKPESQGNKQNWASYIWLPTYTVNKLKPMPLSRESSLVSHIQTRVLN